MKSALHTIIRPALHICNLRCTQHGGQTKIVWKSALHSRWRYGCTARRRRWRAGEKSTTWGEDRAPKSWTVRSGRGWSAVHNAAFGVDMGIVALLVEDGEDPDPVAPGGISALYMASLWGHVVVVEWLVDQGALID